MPKLHTLNITQYNTNVELRYTQDEQRFGGICLPHNHEKNRREIDNYTNPKWAR